MNRIRIFPFILVFVLASGMSLCAQPFEKPSTHEIPRQSIYMELGGNGLIYSLNYDVLFENGYGIRLGGTYLFKADRSGGIAGPYTRIYDSKALLGLVMGHKMIGNGSSKAELGAGFLFGTIYDIENWDFIEPPGLTLTAGYRLYPSDSGKFTFKAAFTPVITAKGFHPWFGISFGITLTPEGDIR